MNELALFAGAGGGILGGKLLGWRTVCAVEFNAYARNVLLARQNDGTFPPFPIWDDVRTFDGRPWRGLVDVVSGGFPCQDISVAGKGDGITGERSGLWSHMARIIGEVRPRFAYVENSPALLTRGLGTVLSDLAALGYDCRWTVLGAADVGGNHQRNRLWILATNMADAKLRGVSERWRTGNFGSECEESCRIQATHAPGLQLETGTVLADADSQRLEEFNPAGIAAGEGRTGGQLAEIGRTDWWAIEPDVRRVAHGVAARVDRIKAIGNGQVPLCAATAWNLLMEAA